MISSHRPLSPTFSHTFIPSHFLCLQLSVIISLFPYLPFASPPSLSLSISFSFSLSFSALSPSVSQSHSRSPYFSHSLCLSALYFSAFSLSHSLSLCPLFLSLSLSLSLFLSLSLSLILSLSISLSLSLYLSLNLLLSPYLQHEYLRCHGRWSRLLNLFFLVFWSIKTAP